MWILVVNEVKMLRNYLMQIFGFVALAVVVFVRTSPHFVTSYFTIFPIILGMTLPQISFTQEERHKTFVFLRSLPLRPRDIVAAKYVVSFAITMLFGVLILIAMKMWPALKLSYAVLGFVLAIASFFAGVSYYQHFLLGLKSAKVALMITFFGLCAPVMFLSQSPAVETWVASDSVQRLYALANTLPGSLIGLGLGALLLLISYHMSVNVFTKQDISRLP